MLHSFELQVVTYVLRSTFYILRSMFYALRFHVDFNFKSRLLLRWQPLVNQRNFNGILFWCLLLC